MDYAKTKSIAFIEYGFNKNLRRTGEELYKFHVFALILI